ncbi:MAG TPA: caspase family protein [Terriglobales bacterium]
MYTKTDGGHRHVVQLLILLALLSFTSLSWPQSPSEFAHSYAMVVGIHAYSSKQWPDLPYGRTDAEAIVTYLKSQGFEVTPLFDRQATKHNILERMYQLATRLQADDRVLFYFSGHGAIERSGDQTWGYLVPYGAADDVDYLSSSDIQDLSRRMKTARHQLFIFDSCFGGQLITRSGGVSPDIPNYIDEVSKRIAREGFAAGGRDQSVLDSGPDGHSVFTAALLRGLGGKADLNGDGFITFAELESYVTPLATNSFQTPAVGVFPGHEGGEFVFRSPSGMTHPAPTPEPLPKIVVQRGDTGQLAEAKKLLQASQFTQALALFRASASAGDPEAMYYMGRVYDHGWGVPVDYSQARPWYEKGAAAGNAEAMASLGYLYGTGHGVTQDYTVARQWYEKGAAAGDRLAMNNLGVLYDSGRGVPQDSAQALQWFEKAAAAGNEVAMRNVGNCYQHGRGVVKDNAKARQWYQKAAAAGDSEASKRLQALSSH